MLAYFGAGRDIDPLPAFNFKILFVDSQPATEFPPSGRSLGYARPSFARFIREEFCGKEEGSRIEKLRAGSCCDPRIDLYQPHKCTLFQSGHVYFVSSEFPGRLTPELEHELRKCDKILLRGFFPHRSVVAYLKKPFTVYCCEGNVFDRDAHREEDTIVDWLWEQEDGGRSDFRIIALTSDEIMPFRTSMRECHAFLEKRRKKSIEDAEIDEEEHGRTWSS